MKKIIIILTFIVSFSSPAQTQDRATGGGNVVLLDLTSTERRSRGNLVACELTYLLAFEDYIYRNGAVTLLRGSLTFGAEPEIEPFYLLKFTAFDLVDETHKLAPLEYVYLSDPNVSYSGKENWMGAAEDGGILVGYLALANPSIDFIGPISLNILRKGGRSDIAIPIVIAMHDQSVALNYNDCEIKLINSYLQKVQ